VQGMLPTPEERGKHCLESRPFCFRRSGLCKWTGLLLEVLLLLVRLIVQDGARYRHDGLSIRQASRERLMGSVKKAEGAGRRPIFDLDHSEAVDDVDVDVDEGWWMTASLQMTRSGDPHAIYNVGSDRSRPWTLSSSSELQVIRFSRSHHS